MSDEDIEVTAAASRSEGDAAVDLRVMKALGHPLRQRILSVLRDHVASPSQVAKELDEPLGNVSYHFRILKKCEAVELVRTRPVRGALEHFYRATMIPMLGPEEWGALPDSIKDQLTAQTLKEIIDAAAAAAVAGGFDDSRSVLARTVLTLDSEAYKELSEAAFGLFRQALALKEAAAERLAELDPEERSAETQEVELTNLLYHSA